MVATKISSRHLSELFNIGSHTDWTVIDHYLPVPQVSDKTLKISKYIC